jgi:hypothetical protein
MGPFLLSLLVAGAAFAVLVFVPAADCDAPSTPVPVAMLPQF